jgi:hypothetical protein
MKTNSITYPIICRAIQAVFLFTVLLSAPAAFSQSVTILPGGITPNQSGGIPRLSYDAIMALPAPQNGDMAYDVSFSCLRLYKKNKWVKLLSDTDIASPSMIGWQIGGPSYDWGMSVATDANGDIYVAGYFKESALFDATEVTADVSGVFNFFIAKYTDTGHLLWVQKVASAASASLNEMFIDTNGNIFLTGYFNANATFGTSTLTSAGMSDVFLAKYNNSGAFQWVQQAGGVADDDARDIGVDGSGNIYITGIVKGSVVFGGTNYIGNADSDVYLAKYKNDGTFQWVRRAVSDNDDYATGLVVEADGKATILGDFNNAITFGNTMLVSLGYTDIFLAQYDSSGNFVWAKKMGGDRDDFSADIKIDNSNNFYVTGTFEKTFYVGGLSVESAGTLDIFIAKFYYNGNINWLKREGGAMVEKCSALALDTQGNIYITGTFNAPSVFGSTTLFGKEYANVFVAKYASRGDIEWVKEMGGKGQAIPNKIIADTKGNAYITGYFVDEFSADATAFTTKGVADIFVVRIRD